MAFSAVQRHVRIGMRDGVLLSADIYHPHSPPPWVTVLVRTCYTKAQEPYAERAAFWTALGYAYVVQDVRGRGDSDGTFYPLINESEDGSDSLDWIASQPWSDGRIVMLGSSYLGWTQVHAACSHNPHLVALALTTTPCDPDREFPMCRGMISPSAGSWMAAMDGHLMQELDAEDIARALRHYPIAEFDTVLGRTLKPWQDWIEHAVRDEYWDTQAYQRRLLECGQPMLHISGWYDDGLNGTLENFAALTSRKFEGRAPAQRMIIGPWLHTTIGQRRIAEMDFGDAAEIDLRQLHREWFDECLKDKTNEEPPVRLFVLGRNTWMHESEWPLRRTEYVAYYAHSDGRANTRNGTGTLSTVRPDYETPDHFQYDPSDPVPYCSTLDWKQVGGPDDYSQLELREDVLVYTSAALEESLLICGPLRVRLFAASTARDTDWTAKILDVYPDGRAIRLNDGAVRARFRFGHHREVFLSPGKVEEYDIDCWATCVELQVGHRLRLEISSSALGRYDVNLNGGGTIGQEVTPVVARQTVYHDCTHPSSIVLPIVRSRNA